MNKDIIKHYWNDQMALSSEYLGKHSLFYSDYLTNTNSYYNVNYTEEFTGMLHRNVFCENVNLLCNFWSYY